VSSKALGSVQSPISCIPAAGLCTVRPGNCVFEYANGTCFSAAEWNTTSRQNEFMHIEQWPVIAITRG